MFTLANVAVIYFTQTGLAAMLNIFMGTRKPRDVWDFFKLTIFPYVLYKAIFKKKDLR